MHDKKNNFGVLTYNSVNIGDEIQSVAAMRFLPQINEYVYREVINSFVPKNKEQTKLIMNAWWMWKPESFPPSKWIIPLMISMYIRPMIREKILTPSARNYLIQYGPVGCRDISTYNWLKDLDIPAYFSGCLTLTLQRNYNIPRKNYILCIDVEQTVVNKIKTLTNRPVYTMSRMISPYYTSTQRLQVAKLVLRAYHDAALVVSPRLHAILPSLAMETPVLRLISQKSKYIGEIGRYSGYENFLNSINTDNELEKLEHYNFDNPEANPNKHLDMRNFLIQKCYDFTGYNNQESLIQDDIDPLVELLRLSKSSKAQINRICYWSDETNLSKVLKCKKHGINQYDLIGNEILETQNIKILYLKHYYYTILSKIHYNQLRKEYYKKQLEKINSYIEVCLYNKIRNKNIY